MAKTFALFFVVCNLAFIHGYAQNNKIKRDTAYVSRLTPAESRVIRNLVNTDTSFVHPQINLNTELFKYDANLLYKYRLDSLNSEISLDYNPYVQSYIDVFIAQRTQQIGRMVSLGNYYFPIFEKALKEKNIPKEFKYLPIVESSLNPHAVSRSGATGLWQFMYTTARGYGLNIDGYVDERKDPITSSYAACRYLQDAYNEFGDWLLALASYNCGMGAVKRALDKISGTVKTYWDIRHLLPQETRDYVPKFIAVAYMMNYFDRHMDTKAIPELAFKIDIDSIYVNRGVSFSSLANVLRIEEKELQILNPSYKKNLVNGTVEDPKRLIIPKVDFYTYAHLFDVLNPDAETKLVYASAKTQSPIAAKKEIHHVVKKGQSLGTIANTYRVEVQDLKVWNKMKTNTIVPGQKIKIIKEQPAQKQAANSNSYRTYVVKAGDTLSSIANSFRGVTVAALKEWNNLLGYNLSVGEILKIKLDL